jgi:N-methylhydantoinase B/oxoprolinase/acetone carboxylase alpha subunit
MTNSLNTPVEAMEHLLPLRVLRYGLRSGSGGAGRHRGGDGLVRSLQALAPMEVSLLTGRRTLAPWGAAGGEPGAPGINRVAGADGRQRNLAPCDRHRLQPGDVLTVETPGGGGWGAP